MDQNRTPLPLLPCGHRTKHTQRIGCCAACGDLFSSDTAFAKHRRDGKCQDPQGAGLERRVSRSAPGEFMWSMPHGDHSWGAA